MPKADGTEGPVVRKVKIEKKQTSGVMVRGGTGIAANGEMVRIDVFRENGKYYFVPVYTADVVRKVLPNRAATHIKTIFRVESPWMMPILFLVCIPGI